MRRHIHINTENTCAPRVDVPSGEMSGGILACLGWMQLWLSCLTKSLTENFSENMYRGFGYLRAFEVKALQDAADIASGKTRAPALIPETARAPEAPKVMLNRRSKRILARGLPVCRQYGWFRYACPRTLNGNQFFELLGRLSVIGRAAVYRLEYKTRLCQSVHWRERKCALRCVSVPSFTPMNLGICAAHLWP